MMGEGVGMVGKVGVLGGGKCFRTFADAGNGCAVCRAEVLGDFCEPASQ